MLIKRRPLQLYVFVENNYRPEHVVIAKLYIVVYILNGRQLRECILLTFAQAQKKVRLCIPHPLWNALPIVQLASVPIREMRQLGMDTIMYSPVQIIPGVVDQRLIGTWEAGQGV